MLTLAAREFWPIRIVEKIILSLAILRSAERFFLMRRLSRQWSRQRPPNDQGRSLDDTLSTAFNAALVNVSTQLLKALLRVSFWLHPCPFGDLVYRIKLRHPLIKAGATRANVSYTMFIMRRNRWWKALSVFWFELHLSIWSSAPSNVKGTNLDHTPEKQQNRQWYSYQTFDW